LPPASGGITTPATHAAGSKGTPEEFSAVAAISPYQHDDSAQYHAGLLSLYKVSTNFNLVSLTSYTHDVALYFM